MLKRPRLVVPAIAAALTLSLATTAFAQAHHHGRHHRRRVGVHHAHRVSPASLPRRAMNSALQLQGSVGNGDLQYGFDRTDITNVQLHGVPIKPSFEINGAMDFQPLGGGRAFLNGDLPVPTDRMQQTIHAIVSHGLTFQAEHQHFYDFNPMVWFIHIRGRGNGLVLARDVHAVLTADGTPLPQSPPSHPTTPLNVQRLERILHAYSAQVSSDGVVTFFVARRNPVFIDGVRVNPSTNIATNIAFEPLNAQGTTAAAVPDFGMTAPEINRVIGTMQAQGWDIGCLYNQETGESPQLYFSHDFKTGNPYTLAREIRRGLNQMNSK